MPITLSPSQQEAKHKVAEWLSTGSGVFRLQGYAGTGKTTVIKSFLEDYEDKVCFAAYTGKAAMVMRKNDLPAVTIHSLIYKPIEPDKAKCEELFKKVREAVDPRERDRLQKELDEVRKVRFTLKPMDESDLADAGLLVLDEVSMVNLEMLKDLKSYDVPILALGDPGQLPPIEGAGALTSGPPDALLTEIHRQAADNPIISYATRARNQVMIPYGTQGTSSHIHKESVTTRQVLDADQILTGKNTTRRDLNTRIRSLHGFSSPYPEVGEKLICLRNDIGIGIFNGMMAEVVAVGEILAHTIELELRLETQQSKPVRVRALRAHFDCYRDKDALKNVKWWMMRDAQEFDFGYAITVHKSQGSQWGNILLWDDKFLSWDRQERARWLYTAITRAAESITIAD